MESKEALEKNIKSLEDAIDIAYKFDDGSALKECLSVLELYKLILKDLERLRKLEEVLIILNLSYEWKLEVQEFEDGTLGYFIIGPNDGAFINITEDQYNNFKEVLEYIKTLE